MAFPSFSDQTVPLGTGTIGDCFKLNLAQIVVANFHLMDDHQTPFAPIIAREHANIVHGHLGYGYSSTLVAPSTDGIPAPALSVPY